MPDLNNIIITGASSGIGCELAKIYAAPGINLGLVGRDKNRMDLCITDCIKQGASVENLICDVCDGGKLEDWICNFDKTHPIDLVIANAGIINTEISKQDIEDIEMIRNVFDVNFYGTVNTLNPVITKMTERHRGQIAIISSLSAYYGLPVAPAYSMSKAALSVYFQSLREKLHQNGISLTLICPGYIDTPMADQLPIRKPFIISPYKAAKIIKNGIASKKRLIAFPLIIKITMNLVQILPAIISDKILFNMCFPRQ